MNTYIFISQTNPNIKIEIQALNYNEAVEVLSVTVKDAKDFQTQ